MKLFAFLLILMLTACKVHEVNTITMMKNIKDAGPYEIHFYLPLILNDANKSKVLIEKFELYDMRYRYLNVDTAFIDTLLDVVKNGRLISDTCYTEYQGYVIDEHLYAKNAKLRTRKIYKKYFFPAGDARDDVDKKELDAAVYVLTERGILLHMGVFQVLNMIYSHGGKNCL